MSAHMPVFILEVDIQFIFEGFPHIPESCGRERRECLGSYANGHLPSIIQEAANVIVSIPPPARPMFPGLFFFFPRRMTYNKMMPISRFCCQPCDFRVRNNSAKQ